MQTPQTIAIIGIEGAGHGIACALSGSRDRILLIDSDHDAALALATRLQAEYPGYQIEAVRCAHAGAWEADMIILNTACGELDDISGKIRDVANQKTLISTVNEVAHVQAFFPNSRIVQSFGHFRREDFEATVAERGRMVCPVSGSDAEAIQSATRLIRQLGFSPAIPA